MKNVVRLVLLVFVGAAVLYAFGAGSPRSDANEDRARQEASSCVPGTECLAAASAQSAASEASKRDASDVNTRKVVVYYFHTNSRCVNCRKFEVWGSEALQRRFAEPLKAGALEWRVLNVEEPQNRHFVDNYRLHTKSIVLSSSENGKETQWKNLDRIWQLLGDKEAFSQYLESETKAFLNAGAVG
jgi:hypothetical protein